MTEKKDDSTSNGVNMNDDYGNVFMESKAAVRENSPFAVFERVGLMLRYMKYATVGLMDPIQVAYQTNRSVDDTDALASVGINITVTKNVPQTSKR